MTIALVAWNRERIFIGSDGRLTDNSGILTDCQQKIVIDGNRNFVVSSWGDSEIVPNHSNTSRVAIRVAIKQIIDAANEENENYSFDQYCQFFDGTFQQTYSFMNSGFFICGMSNGYSRICRKDRGSAIEFLRDGNESWEISCNYKLKAKRIYDLFNASYSDACDEDADMNDNEFKDIMEETLHRVYEDRTVNAQCEIGDSFDIVRIDSEGATLILQSNTPFKTAQSTHLDGQGLFPYLTA